MRRWTLQGFAIAVEAMTLAVTLALMALALAVATGRIEARYREDRVVEARKAGALVNVFLDRAAERFGVLVRDPGARESAAYFGDFSDLYEVGRDLRVRRILSAEPGSAVFEGFSLASSVPGRMLVESGEGGVVTSGIVRGVEDERPCIYYAARIGEGWLLGRMGVDSITAELARIAEYAGSVILIVSADGRVLTSTRSGIGLDILPKKLGAEAEVGGVHWMVGEADSPLLQDRIVVFTPRAELDRLLAAFPALGFSMAAVFLFGSIVRSTRMRSRFLRPLERLSALVAAWDPDRQDPAALAATETDFLEVRALADAFVSKSAEVRDALEALRRKDEEVRALNAGLENRVEERTAELESANRRLGAANLNLSRAVEELTETRDRLVVSEKMAALGRLSAGIAHELNTPLGALRSSAEFLAGTLPGHLAALPSLVTSIGADSLAILEELLGRGFADAPDPGFSGRRASHRKLVTALEEAGASGPGALADGLQELGIHEADDPMVGKLAACGRAQVLVSTAVALVGAVRSGRIVAQAAEKAAWTVNALRTYSRQEERGKPVRVDIVSDLETVLALLNNKLKRGIEVEREYGADIRVYGRPDELDQVWINLVNNAVDAMDGNGRLTVRALREGPSVVVSIEDDGKGIPEESKARIFTPFFTTKPEGMGLGLGLDICKRIVESHEGTLSFESRPGRTVFTTRLPAYSGEGTIGFAEPGEGSEARLQELPGA
ncbi:MAG: hypothetical protein JXA15_04275 [Spirochaetales bacterium]|nr:hypothetical protein [Spirochaetales bacterium]